MVDERQLKGSSSQERVAGFVRNSDGCPINLSLGGPPPRRAHTQIKLVEPILLARQTRCYFPATLALVGRWTSVISPIISQTRMIPQDISNSYHLCPWRAERGVA